MTQIHCIATLYMLNIVGDAQVLVEVMQGHAMFRAGIEIEPFSTGFVQIPMLGLCQLVMSTHECEGYIA